MIIWIVDLMPVKWTFTVEPPPAKSVLVKPETPYPFEQTRYYYSGSEPYFWHRLEELDARAAYFQKHLERSPARPPRLTLPLAGRRSFLLIPLPLSPCVNNVDAKLFMHISY